MARPLRIEFPGAVYHITSRGDGRDDIYYSDEDRERFLKVLSHVVERFGWVCHAWCLMTNHYHLMIETPKGNLSKGMRQLNGVYTQQFNRAHGRVGHVFQGRYKAILVEKDAHLLELSRYIVRNPLAAGMVKSVKDWDWSSYRSTAGLERTPDFACTSWILEQFGGSTVRYKEYVDKACIDDAPLKPAKGSHVLGGEAFRRIAQKNIHANSEAPRSQQYIARLSLTEIQKNALGRGEWMANAYRLHGYTMREIADFAKVHYSLVSKEIKAWEEKNSTFKT